VTALALLAALANATTVAWLLTRTDERDTDA
jgi:hypothetical protein